MIFIICVQFAVAPLQNKFCRVGPHRIKVIVGAVVKFQKVSDSFVMPLCLSASINLLAPPTPERIFLKKNLRILLKYNEKFQLWFKSNKNKTL